jgi:TetR/AcrR family transcriptional repressor of nem operon
MARAKCFDEQTALRKAMQVFWEQGYSATSIQDLVDRMGINRASLYDTYGDKHRLYLKALEAYQAEESQVFHQLLNTPNPSLAVLEQLFEQLIAQAQDDEQQGGCLMVNSAVERSQCDHAVADFIAQNNAAMVESLARFVSRLQEQGELDSAKDATQLAHYLLMAIMGFKVITLSYQDPSLLRGIAERIMAGVKC